MGLYVFYDINTLEVLCFDTCKDGSSPLVWSTMFDELLDLEIICRDGDLIRASQMVYHGTHIDDAYSEYLEDNWMDPALFVYDCNVMPTAWIDRGVWAVGYDPFVVGLDFTDSFLVYDGLTLV